MATTKTATKKAASKRAGSRSGNPATRAAATKVSSIAEMKKKAGGLIELPSGFVMKFKNPGGMSVFMKAGLIPNSLMGVIQKSIDSGKDPDMSEIVKDGQVDMEMANDMIEMMRNLFIQAAVDPQVHPIPEDESDRDDDLLYVDEVDEEDVMFIFQWLTGGTTNVAQFRRERDTDMASLRGGPAMGRTTKSASRRK